jgi:DNA polymerase-4
MFFRLPISSDLVSTTASDRRSAPNTYRGSLVSPESARDDDSRETTFQTDTNNWQTIARSLAELVKNVVDDIRGRGYKGKNVTVKIRFSDFQTQTRACTLKEPTDNLELIRKTAFLCLGKVELKKKVRLVGVRVGLAK